MARDIPLDRALTDDDRRYLRERGAWGQALETRVDAAYPPDPADLEAYNARERADSVTAPGDIALREENAQLKEQLAALQAQMRGEAPEGDEEEDVPPYDTWQNQALVDEIKARNTANGTSMPITGTKSELVARLQEDDARQA
jgi:hypothetical protein